MISFLKEIMSRVDSRTYSVFNKEGNKVNDNYTAKRAFMGQL